MISCVMPHPTPPSPTACTLHAPKLFLVLAYIAPDMFPTKPLFIGQNKPVKRSCRNTWCSLLVIMSFDLRKLRLNSRTEHSSRSSYRTQSCFLKVVDSHQIGVPNGTPRPGDYRHHASTCVLDYSSSQIANGTNPVNGYDRAADGSSSMDT
jgi:hypothetical protein